MTLLKIATQMVKNHLGILFMCNVMNIAYDKLTKIGKSNNNLERLEVLAC